MIFNRSARQHGQWVDGVAYLVVQGHLFIQSSPIGRFDPVD